MQCDWLVLSSVYSFSGIPVSTIYSLEIMLNYQTKLPCTVRKVDSAALLPIL